MCLIRTQLIARYLNSQITFPFPVGDENSPLALAKGTSPHILGSCAAGPVSALGAARAGAGARLGRHNLETGSGCGNNVSLAHTTGHSQAGDGLGHPWGSQSLGTAAARCLLNTEPPSSGGLTVMVTLVSRCEIHSAGLPNNF